MVTVVDAFNITLNGNFWDVYIRRYRRHHHGHHSNTTNFANCSTPPYLDN